MPGTNRTQGHRLNRLTGERLGQDLSYHVGDDHVADRPDRSEKPRPLIGLRPSEGTGA